MSAEQIYQWWFIWLAVAIVIVLAAALLLITIIILARQIANLAASALALVEEIEQNTKPIWQLNATNKTAHELLQGAQAIRTNATTIVDALAEAERHRAA